MNSATHTPTPWEVHPTVNQHRYNAALDFGPSGIAVGVVWGPFEKRAMDAETEANAAFIVRACNAHDDLVAALKTAREMIAGRDIEFAVVDISRPDMGLGKFIDAALSKARAA